MVLIAADAVRPASVEWAWAGRVPIGSVTVLAGMPGLGKSTIALDLAAKWSTGLADGAWKGTPVGVLIASAEDSSSTTIVPRLMAAAANCSQVHFVSVSREGLPGNIALPDDLDRVAEQMRAVRAQVLIVDPLMAHLPGTVNSWRDQDIRRALAPLARLAEDLQAVVLTLAHLNKTQASEVLTRIGGSIGIAAAARSVLLAADNQETPEGPERFLAHVKCNVGPLAPTLRYQLEARLVTTNGETFGTSGLSWKGEAVTVHGSDLLIPTTPEERSARADARAWLKATLAEGSQPAETLLKEGERLGFSKATLRRAKDDLGIVAEKTRFNGEGAWCWILPPPSEGAQGSAEGAQIQNREHLRETDDKKPTYVNHLAEGAQTSNIEHLRGPVEHLRGSEEVIDLAR